MASPQPLLPTPSLAKLEQRHTGRLRQKGNLLTERGGGEGGGKARAYDGGESLVLYKSFNTLWDHQWTLTIWKTIFHFETDQELDPDLTPSFTHNGKSEKNLTFVHSISSLYCHSRQRH